MIERNRELQVKPLHFCRIWTFSHLCGFGLSKTLKSFFCSPVLAVLFILIFTGETIPETSMLFHFVLCFPPPPPFCFVKTDKKVDGDTECSSDRKWVELPVHCLKALFPFQTAGKAGSHPQLCTENKSLPSEIPAKSPCCLIRLIWNYGTVVLKRNKSNATIF